MERDGLNKSHETREKISKLRSEIAALQRDATHNIDDDNTKLEFAISDLDGLSKDFIKKLEPVKGKEKTHVYISLKKPELTPALGSATNSEVRRKL